MMMINLFVNVEGASLKDVYVVQNVLRGDFTDKALTDLKAKGLPDLHELSAKDRVP